MDERAKSQDERAQSRDKCAQSQHQVAKSRADLSQRDIRDSSTINVTHQDIAEVFQEGAQKTSTS